MSGQQSITKRYRYPLGRLCLCWLVFSCGATAQSWPQWGGPQRNFMVDAKGLAETWPAGGPKRLWSRALGEGKADAVVYDAPVLLYYASRDGKGKVQVVGSIFRKENYGIVFPPDSPYRKPVNEALLKIKEDGTYDRLYTKWFGGNGS